MDDLMLGFGIGSSVLGLGILIYLKKVRKKMKRFVLRFEEIMDKVD
ncbi:MAG: hypothetical protein KAU03_06705 [Candidatus Altiarchaeales archaeon]|nr:hypothetical protein [Candidatus Altiarchaeales archaeon]